MADLTNLVISITTEGGDKALQTIDQVKNAGKQAADIPIKFKVDVTSAEQAIAVMKELKAAGTSGVGVFTIKVGSAAEALTATQQIKSAMSEIGGESHKVNVIYDEGATALKNQRVAAKQAADERRAQQAIDKQASASKRDSDKQAAALIAQKIKDEQALEGIYKKAGSSIETSSKQIISNFEKQQAAIANQKGSIEQLNDRFLRMARIAASLAVAFFAIRGAITVFRELLDTVDEFNISTIGIASTITDLAKDQSDPYKNFTQNLAYARDMYVQLENSANKFFSSGQEMIQAWNILTQQGIVLQGDQIDNLGTIVDKIKLLTQGQVSSVQIAQELRAALMGQARPTDQLARIVKDRLGGAWKEVFQQIRETQSLAPLAKMFSGLEVARPYIQDTLTSQLTTLWTNLRQVTRGGMENPYRDIVESFKEWNLWIRENKDLISKDLRGAWESIKTVLSDIKELLKDITSILKNPVLMALIGGALGGARGGVYGAGLGAVLGGAVSTRYFAPDPEKELAEIDKKLEAKYMSRGNVGNFFSFSKKEIGKDSFLDVKLNELIPLWGKYTEALKKAEEQAKNLAEVPKTVPEPPQPTPMDQRPHVWDDASIKALQTASNLVVSFNHELSNISGNSMDKIAADMAKMNQQIDKTIFSMQKENETKKLSIAYEQQLKDIRDKVISQELERRNRDIYAYSLEGVPETISNQFAKIQFSSEEFWRKFGSASKGALGEIAGDPILKMVENAKTADKVMADSAKNWKDSWKEGLDTINKGLDDIVTKLNKISPVKIDLSGISAIVPQQQPYYKATGEYVEPSKSYLSNFQQSADGLKKSLDSVTNSANNTALNISGLGVIANATSVAAANLGNEFKVLIPQERSKSGASLPNNNPGNLVYVPGSYQEKYGAVPGQGHGSSPFAKFPTPEAGFAALVEQVQKYQERDLTLTQLMTGKGNFAGYSPRSENPNIDNTIAVLSKLLSITAGTNITAVSAVDLARALAVVESQTKVVGTFTELQAGADSKRKEMLGGKTDKEVETAKTMHQFKLAELQTGLKLTENERSYYAILAGMNLPAEKLNEYSQEALDLELQINRAKAIQFIAINGVNEADKEHLLRLDATVAAEKKKQEAINAQIRPLEAQNTLLSQYNKYISGIESNAPFVKDQLAYRTQSLEIQQRIAQIELQSFLIKEKDRLQLTTSDENHLKGLLKQQQINEQIKLMMDKWQGQGAFGGMSLWSMERVNKSFSEISNAVKSLMNDLESTISSGIADQIVNYLSTGKVDIKTLGQNIAKVFIQKGVELQVGQMFGGMASLWQKFTGQDSLGKEGSAQRSANIFKQGSEEAGMIFFRYIMQSVDYLKSTVGGFGGLGGGGFGLGDGGFGGFQGLNFNKNMMGYSGGQYSEGYSSKEDKTELGGGLGGYSSLMKDNSNFLNPKSINKYESAFMKMASSVGGTWQMTQSAMTAASLAGDVMRVASLATKGEEGIGIMKILAKSSILVSAAEAAASTYANVAKIPIVGWILAPIVAAAAFAVVAAYGAFGGSTSAGGSGYSPSGGGGPGEYSAGAYHTGGIIRAHSGMFLPTGYGGFSSNLTNDEVPLIGQRGEYMISRRGVRAAGVPLLNAINSGNIPTTSKEESQPIVFHFAPVVNAIDAKGVDKVLEKHGRTIAKTLKGQYRNNYIAK